MFFPEDEHLVIMNFSELYTSMHGQCYALTDDNLMRLRDVGAQTLINFAVWRAIEEQGWGYLDRLVEQVRRFGMRCVLGAYIEAPDGLPDHCYCKRLDGTYGTSENNTPAMSIWGEDAKRLILNFYKELIERYYGSDILVINSGLDTGEIVLPHKPAFYGRAALVSHLAEVGGRPDLRRPATVEWLRRSVVDHFMAIDELLITQHNEIWQSLHPWLAWARRPHCANGNFAQEDIIRAQADRWPDAARVLLQYTYFSHNKPLGNVIYKDLIDSWRRKYGIRVIVEAGYCSGLDVTAPAAIAKGFRGQIVGILHPCVRTRVLEHWQLVAIANAVKLWGGV